MSEYSIYDLASLIVSGVNPLTYNLITDPDDVKTIKPFYTRDVVLVLYEKKVFEKLNFEKPYYIQNNSIIIYVPASRVLDRDFIMNSYPAVNNHSTLLERFDVKNSNLSKTDYLKLKMFKKNHTLMDLYEGAE